MAFNHNSGPCIAGTVLWTTGTTPGTVANTGSTVLSQTITIDASTLNPAGDSMVVAMLPAYSQITDIFVDVGPTITFTGAATVLNVGLGYEPANYDFFLNAPFAAAGREATTSLAQAGFPIQNWVNVNATVTAGTGTQYLQDVPVYMTYAPDAAATAMAGGITVTVQYVQKGTGGIQRPAQS